MTFLLLLRAHGKGCRLNELTTYPSFFLLRVELPVPLGTSASESGPIESSEEDISVRNGRAVFFDFAGNA